MEGTSIAKYVKSTAETYGFWRNFKGQK